MSADQSAATSSDLPPSTSTEIDMTFPPYLAFRCAVTDSKGPRRYMEDAHSIVVPFAGIRGQGFFAIFDGHAGKQAAEWCGEHFAPCLIDALRRDTSHNIPDVLNQTFHDVDINLTKLTEDSEGKMHAGCTAVTAFLRLEDAEGKQSFLPPDYSPLDAAVDDSDSSGGDSPEASTDAQPAKKSNRTRIKNALKSLSGSQISSPAVTADAAAHSAHAKLYTPPASPPLRRVLYCANAGDARGVLCRSGKAVRLTYDHKGSDKQEAKRIVDAGGFVMSGRVNGVLAVTRSLGDSSMKEFVVGSPYTTETELNEEDEFLILACDGLWDVVEDQAAVELVRAIPDPRKAAEHLLDHAYRNYSTDNVTVLVIRFRNPPETIRSR